MTHQRARTEELIDQRQTTFRARTGQDMSQDNIWLAGRRQEQDALGQIILTLEQTRLADEAYTDAVLLDGQPTGDPNQALDTACALCLTDTGQHRR